MTLSPACTASRCTDYFGASGLTNLRLLGPVPLTWISVGSCMTRWTCRSGAFEGGLAYRRLTQPIAQNASDVISRLEIDPQPGFHLLVEISLEILRRPGGRNFTET